MPIAASFEAASKALKRLHANDPEETLGSISDLWRLGFVVELPIDTVITLAGLQVINRALVVGRREDF